ncbi:MULTISPECIES: hypothetical protein [Acidobacteriaceae]|uniref:hypothetical protein n=1 Tax=Acidobacteriaceae TaxID=204434 RepID=UPI00131A983B|nr:MULTISPECIES: hypothetical protein [Acidobacteriaceae]MDW5264867.1 hypothetical protein [Edaphobacter sp.]
MNQAWLISFFTYLEPVLCAAALFFLLRSKASRSFGYLIALLGVRLGSYVMGMGLIHLNVIEVHLAYRLYFYVYWGSYALEAVLSLLVVYSIFKLSMAPLKGLQTLGMLIFRWVAAISVAVSIGIAIAPHHSGLDFVIALVTQIQQTSSILTLCLLLFVCFAIRPMGLSYRSRIFGISLGLGILATTDLVRAAWLSHFSTNMYSSVNMISELAMCAALCIWAVYFAFPEPKRRLIVLPTTSPFLRWNQISQALGDDPGYVAVGGIAPELFAPAEIEIMKRASAMMPAQSVETQSNLRSISA